jgi:hypothetical protein
LERGVGGIIFPFNEIKNLHFDYKEGVHKSFIYYKENGSSHDLDLLMISH